MGHRTNHLFLTLCLTLTAGLVWTYSIFIDHFGGDHQAEFDLITVTQQLREERFQRSLAESRLRDLSVEVASVLPARSLASSEKLKNLSQVLREPAAVSLDLSGVIFERAKSKFSSEKYMDALKEFRRLREDFPLSPHAIESAFLAGESAFLAGQTEICAEFADLMVEQYPEHELTGFLLLRVAQISEQNNQVLEAGELYRTVQKNFKNPALIDQARRMAKALDSE